MKAHFLLNFVARALSFGAPCVVAGLMVCGLQALADPVRYVAQYGGNDANNGLTENAPFVTLQKGIDSLVAAGGGGTVYVGEGSYAPITSANHPIRIESKSGPSSTYISGNNTTRCATLGDPSLVNIQNPASSVQQNATVLSGFTLVYGSAQGAHPASGFGGGVFGGTLTNCVIYACSAVDGGGAAFSKLINCELVQNTAVNGGGAHSSELTADCTLFVNSASGNGGGMYGGSAYSCRLLINYSNSGSGGGAYGATLVNCAFNYNEARDGGGASKSTLYNCTLVGNGIHVQNISGTPVDANSGGVDDSTCYNSIFLNNVHVDAGLYTQSNGDLRSRFYHCCLPVIPVTGSGNITDSPKLLNEDDYYFHIDVGSPCINAGNNAYVPVGVLTDLDGNARIAHGTVDIGCHEFSDNIPVWVTLDARGGSVTPGDLELVFGGKYDGLIDASRHGYVFNGWTLDGVPVTQDSDVTRLSSHTLVAQWTPVTVTVHVDLGGVGDTTVYLPFGSVYMYNIPNPVKTGHTFAGWLDVGNDQVFQVTTLNTHTVHPAWTAKMVTVQADLDGDGVADTAVSLPFGSVYAAGIAEPVKAGQDFSGWMDGTGATVTIVDNENAHTVYSKWSAAGVAEPSGAGGDENLAVPVITGIRMDALKRSVTITVSNCVQSAGVYWLEGADDLSAKFLPLSPTDYETSADKIKDGIWLIPDIPMNTKAEQFFYKVGVGSRE